MKMHELLALEPDLKNAAANILASLKAMFASGDKLLGETKTYEPLLEEGPVFEPIRREVVTTVPAALQDMRAIVSNFLDITIAKEITNQGTAADVVIDGEVLLMGMPATALLNLEARLAELRVLFDAIPTNDTSKRWEWDGDYDLWTSGPQVQYKTEKVMDSYVAYEATDHHPAQVHVFNKDVRVGSWTTYLRSGMLSPRQKRALVEHTDAMIRAVKTARMRANDTDVVKIDVATPIFDYIFEGAGLL